MTWRTSWKHYNNSNKQLLSIYVLGALTAWLGLSHPTSLSGGHHSEPHLADEEQKPQRGNVTCSGPHS